jgi:hypothetical protein
MGKRGPKPQYERVGSNKVGAPTLSTRLDPLVYQHVVHHPEEPRPYIERLVRQDAERTGIPLGSSGSARRSTSEPSQELDNGEK